MIEEKRWTPELENKILEIWEKEDIYKFDPNAEKVVVVDTPPPYPAPDWHIAAAIHYALQDVFVRALRMLGYSVFFPIGFDRNGIPVEWYVEKHLKITPFDKPREEYIEICHHALDEYTEKMYKVVKRLGNSYNWGPYLTDSEDYRLLTQQTFIELWKRGLIYEDYRPNNWCPHCKTTIADAEVEYVEKEGTLYYIKFKVKETGEEILIATTRPELLPACKLVIFHPEDGRYKHLEGKTAIVPLFNIEVPIKPCEYADPSFGTGLVMICSYGDFTDVKIFREFNLKPVIVIDTEGRITVEPYKGLKVEEARKKIVEDLKEKGLLVKEEKIKQRIPVHDKCGTRIEIIPMKEWYLKQVEFKEELLKIVNEMKFIPEKYRQVLINWINSITQDWPISRRRVYGTEIPMWYCKKCGYIYVPEKLDKYVRPWKESPGIKCPKCGSEEWEGETRTFDTWMDSSISVLYITKDFPGLFERAIKIRPQGKDIIRTWLYYTLLRVYQLKGKGAFDIVWITGHGVDEHGRKMSKSKGNVILPEPIIEKYGADAVRFFAVMECSIGDDYRISEQRIAGAAKFLTKLLNIARFISQFEKPKSYDGELEEEDKKILEEVKELLRLARKKFEELDLHELAIKLRSFTWERFANDYIEKVKQRARNGDKRAIWTMYEVLKYILLMLAPICPFITDFIWRKLYKETSIHLEKLPEV